MKHQNLVRMALVSAIGAALVPAAWATSTDATASQPQPAAHAAAAAPSNAPSASAPAVPAQATTPPASAQSTKTQSQKATSLQNVVVTGNVNQGGVKQIDASYAVNTLSESQIHDFAPHSTADLLKTIPGMWVEASGGVTGANVYVSGFPGAGDAHFVNVELNGMPLYGAYGLSFMSSPGLFRIDDTVKRVEVVQNGPNDIFGAGRPGATVNFIQKTGVDTPWGAGSVRATVGLKGFRRIDLYWGGQIAPDWYLAGGGFAREGDGVHHTAFPINRGGQMEAILTHTFDEGNGTFSVSARHTNDNNMFLTDSPMISENGHIKFFPNFDPRDDVLQGADTRRVNLEVTPGNPPGTTFHDLAQGRGLHLNVFGTKFDWKFAPGWDISNKANYVNGDVPTNAFFNGSAPPQTISSFIASSITAANGNAAAVSAVGGMATGGAATFVDGGGAVPANQLVVQQGFWSVRLHIRSFTDNLNVSREIFPGNTLTAGGYFASYGSNDLWDLGNNMLMTLRNNARLVRVRLNNGVAVTSSGGFTGASTDAFAESWRGRNLAGYLSDTWKIGRLTLTGGARIEHQHAVGYQRLNMTTDLDGNPATLYNNGASVFNGKTKRFTSSITHLAWSAGANYSINSNMSVYGRASRGQLFPMFDDIQGGIGHLQTVRQYEIGYKAQNRFYSANISLFHNKFSNLPFSALETVNGQTVNVASLGGGHAKGVQFELTLSPTSVFRIKAAGDYLKGEYTAFEVGGLNDAGNQLQRQPKFQYHITPYVFLPTGWGAFRVFATYTHVGTRFNGPDNLQTLPSYHTIDAGLEALVGSHWDLRLTGTNITNQLGLTEGNVRALGVANTGNTVFYGRSIFGRTWKLSAKYMF